MLLLIALTGFVNLPLAVGDTFTAAGITGVFTLLNTVLVVYLNVRTRKLEKVLKAPRRAVYDGQGHLIGTVVALEDPYDPVTHFATVPIQQPNRRADDPDPNEA